MPRGAQRQHEAEFENETGTGALVDGVPEVEVAVEILAGDPPSVGAAPEDVGADGEGEDPEEMVDGVAL